MAKVNTIQVLTDLVPDVDAKQGFPGFDRISRLPQLRDIDIQAVKRNLATLIRGVSTIVLDAGNELSDFELEEVVFNAAIDESGNVSLVSVLGLGGTSHSGIELRMRRQRTTAIKKTDQQE